MRCDIAMGKALPNAWFVHGKIERPNKDYKWASYWRLKLPFSSYREDVFTEQFRWFNYYVAFVSDRGFVHGWY